MITLKEVGELIAIIRTPEGGRLTNRQGDIWLTIEPPSGSLVRLSRLAPLFKCTAEVRLLVLLRTIRLLGSTGEAGSIHGALNFLGVIYDERRIFARLAAESPRTEWHDFVTGNNRKDMQRQCVQDRLTWMIKELEGSA